MEFWNNKIERTVKRDKLVKQELKKSGWKIIEVWECELKPKKIKKTLDKLILRLKQEVHASI